MTSFAIGEAFNDVLVLAHVHHEGWSNQQHLSTVYSGDYDTWIVRDARTKVLSLAIRGANQGHDGCPRLGGCTLCLVRWGTKRQ